MKQFNFNALDETGQEHNGFIEASDQGIVLQQLRQRGLYVLNLREDERFTDDRHIEKERDAWVEVLELLPVTTSQKVFFFKQLALMLRSGMSITEAFEIITKMQHGHMRLISVEINKSIKRGESFSAAMSGYSHIFSKLAIQMIRSAETSGELDVTLLRIARYLEHKAALKRQVISAMSYPAFTLLAAIGVFVFLLVYIIPKFAEFLERSGKPVPPSTQLMIDIGNFFHGNWPVLLGLFIAGLIALIVTYRRSAGRMAIERFFLAIPIIGATLKSAAMSQLCWGMGILLKSGIPVVDSLRIIADMINNSVIAQSVSLAGNSVVHGHDLGSSFKQPYITSLVLQLMIVGERSGSLVQVMEEATAYYEDDLKSKTRTLANMVEPMAIILIGGIVGFVYFGFFQALLSVSTR